MVRGSRLRSSGAAVLLALALLLAGRQISLHGWYAPHPAYRAQVDALLDGRLALTTTPDGLRHDLAWTPRGAQQVWGLGVPLWQLPFEALGRAIGVSPFPDRIALAAWLAVMLYVLIRAFRRRELGGEGDQAGPLDRSEGRRAGRQGAQHADQQANLRVDQQANLRVDQQASQRVDQQANLHVDQQANLRVDQQANLHVNQQADQQANQRADRSLDTERLPSRDARLHQIGALLLTALLPGLITVLRGRIEAYEEAAIYAYGAAMILLGGLLAVHRTPTPTRYLLLVGFAGLTGLLRPTVWFYGLATALIASALLIRHRGWRAARTIALGMALFAAGGGVLYATNALRFGRGTEFGHRLNVHSLPGNIVATRFSYPFERAGTLEATKELLGSLFDGPERRSKRGFYQPALHRGQSPLPRWREYYFTTFSWPYLPVILAGLVLGVLAWRRRGDPWARMLGTWAVLGGAPLFVFYLHSPSVSSRYQLDLAPAIAALLVITWRACVARWPRRALALLVVLWAAAVVTSKYARPRRVSDPIDRDRAAITAYEISRATAYDHPLPGAYDQADPFLPIWTDVIEDYDRCTDASGAPLACDAPPVPGDALVRGHRFGQQWFVDRYVIPDAPLEPVCRPDGSGGNNSGGDHNVSGNNTAGSEDGRSTNPGDNPRTRSCSFVPAVLADPASIHDTAFLSTPALYLNAFQWDLASMRVPPATMFYVDDADYIVLDVTGPLDTDWDHAIRVAVGLDHLPLTSVAETRTGAQLRFAGHKHPGLEVAFVAFGPDTELDRPQSRFGLRSIRWRD